MVAGQQMFDQRRYAPLFFAIEFRVFKKRKVPRTADPPHVVQHEPGFVTQFIELFAGGLRDHGRELYKFKKYQQQYFGTSGPHRPVFTASFNRHAEKPLL
jgi:hypothetical protein